MKAIERLNSAIGRLHLRCVTAQDDRERGDVPGWVMITLMTAIIVVLIWGIASKQLTTMLGDAFDKVTGTVKSN